MFKSSFTVGYLKFRNNEVENNVVLGVTSIVPNLNGFLFFTEDGENHFIEKDELSHQTLCGMYMSYFLEDELDPNAVVHDHRKK